MCCQVTVDEYNGFVSNSQHHTHGTLVGQNVSNATCHVRYLKTFDFIRQCLFDIHC